MLSTDPHRPAGHTHESLGGAILQVAEETLRAVCEQDDEAMEACVCRRHALLEQLRQTLGSRPLQPLELANLESAARVEAEVLRIARERQALLADELDTVGRRLRIARAYEPD